MCMARAWVWIGVLFLVAGCGGGGGSDKGNPPAQGQNSLNGLSYPAPPTFVVGSEIAALNPTVNGSVTSYSVSPALPAGLSLNSTTGVISGTPTVATAQASYTVTASNSGGSTTAGVMITVNDVAPALVYGSAQLSLIVDKSVSLAPTNSGGSASTWSISPALPAGLDFNQTNGVISGTPTAVSDLESYVVTASNSGGQSSFTVAIEVESGELVHLGHTAGVDWIRYDGSRILSRDTYDGWVLWNAQTTETVAHGQATNFCEGMAPECEPEIELAGPTAVVQTTSGFEIYASDDGERLAAITAPTSWWKLAPDGSYLAVGHSSGLTVFAPSGTVLLTRAGNYSQAAAFASPTEIQVAAGPAGANVVETIAVASGNSTVSSPFQGEFYEWFLDGERFITRVNTQVWVYSKGVTLLDSGSLPITNLDRLSGWGDWFWAWYNGAPGQLRIYAVGASTSPAATYPLGYFTKVISSGSTLAFGDAGVSIIDLSASTISKVDYPTVAWGIYAATTSADWIVSANAGLLEDGPSAVAGTHKYYGYGAPRGIAGSSTRIAVATSVGRILLFDAVTKEPAGDIELLSDEVELSADGTVLAAVDSSDSSVKIYSLPSAIEVYTYPSGGATTQSISLTPSGEFLSRDSSAGREVIAIPSGSVVWSVSTAGQEAVVSPDGSRIAAAGDSGRCACTSTDLYLDAAFVTSLYGIPAAWLDDDRVLINKFVTVNARPVLDGVYVFDGAGQQLQLTQLPEIWPAKVVSPTTIYSPNHNTIYSLTTGQILWEGPMHWAIDGDIAGTRVIYFLGNTIRAESY